MSERAGEQTMSDERAGRLEAALIECAALSGEDMDGDETRAPTWPPVEVWAVRCVKELREAYDEALSEGSAQRAGEGESPQAFNEKRMDAEYVSGLIYAGKWRAVREWIDRRFPPSAQRAGEPPTPDEVER